MKIIFTATLAVMLTIAPMPAHSSEPAHPAIQAILDEVPGGVVLDYHHAAWPALGMEMAAPVGRSVGACATGKVCAFARASTTGAQLSWSTCATHNVPSSFVVKSIANARDAGSIVKARNGTTVLATATSGTWKNVVGTTTNLQCFE